jgi:molecular chaperone DnaK
VALDDVVVGIDLGTSRSAVAIVDNGMPVPIPDDQGRTEHPSVVHFPERGDPIVGHAAVPFLVKDPANTVFAAKRLIGRPFHDREVKAARAVRPYALVKGAGEAAATLIQVRGRAITPSQVSAEVLRHLKDLASRRLGKPVKRAVIGCPANFNEAQREATRVAASLAELEVVRVVNEPTAASLSVHPPLPDGVYLVYDFGGGTFDVTVLDRTANVFRVLATQGVMELGGDDVDRALANRLADDLARESGVDLRRDPSRWASLVAESERLKIALSQYDSMPLRMNAVGRNAAGVVNLVRTVDRALLGSVADALIAQSLRVVEETMDRAKVKPGDLSGLLLVGGSSQMPAVRNAVERMTGKRATPGVNPSGAVALGAAVLASGLTSQEGASTNLLLDVMPFTLGIAAHDGSFLPVVPRNSALPWAGTTTLVTHYDGQSEMPIRVLQGEGVRAVDNVLLGIMKVSGLAVAKKGEVEVEVHLEVECNGDLRVAAVDLSTGRVHDGFVRTHTGLADQELDVARGAGAAP